MSKYDNLRAKLRGPVYAVCPSFNADGSFDENGTESYVNYLIDKGAKIIMVTAGTSRFNLLEENEIKLLNEIVARSCKGRAVSIVANQMIGSTGSAVRYAEHAQQIGADILLVYYPERHYHDDYVYDYFNNIAASSDVGLMIHAYPFRNARASAVKTVDYSVDLCRRLASIDKMVGMKEEHGNTVHTYKLGTQAGDVMSFIVAGGSMRLFLSCALYNIQGFLTGVGNFVPAIEEDFYSHMINGNKEEALKLVTDIEEVFFTAAMPMGWHVAMKGALDILGLMPKHERSPLRSMNSEEEASLRTALRTMQSRSSYFDNFDI